MIRTVHSSAKWLSAGVLLGAVFAAQSSMPAQPQHNPPAKSSAQKSSSAQEDPLAPVLQQAQQSIDKNDFNEALEPLQKYIAQRPDNPYAHFQLGYAYAGLKRWEEAKSEFSRAIALDPKMAPAHLNLGLVLMDSDPAGAADSFRRAADLQPTEGRPRYLAGVALERAAKFSEAVEQYRAALAISPNNYEYHFALGRTLLRNGDAAGAEGEFRRAVAARSDSAPARLGLANALLAQKQYEAGTDALAEYLKLNPNDRGEHFERAAGLVELNRFDEALTELNLSEAGATPTPDGLKMRGDIYLHTKKWKEAAETLAEAVRQSPQDQALPVWLGHVEVELHEYPKAISILGPIYANNPQSADALRDLVRAYFLNENYAETLDAMDRLAKMETPKPISWFVRGICYDKLSRKAEAIEAYQKFLDLDSGQNDTQDFQARRRIYTLQSELGQAPKRQKH